MAQRSAERAQFLADVITTAAEGGINYWAVVERYRWYDPTLEGGTCDPGPAGSANALLLVTESEETDIVHSDDCLLTARIAGMSVTDVHWVGGVEGCPVAQYAVDPDAIARVFATLVNGTPKGWNDADVKRMLRASRESDAGEIDAGDADCLVQLACFGEVMYG